MRRLLRRLHVLVLRRTTGKRAVVPSRAAIRVDDGARRGRRLIMWMQRRVVPDLVRRGRGRAAMRWRVRIEGMRRSTAHVLCSLRDQLVT